MSEAKKTPLHKLNFFNKLNKKKNGKLMNTLTFIKDGNTAKSLAPFTYSSHV